MIKTFGMVNMSSLCYFNSMIQALSSLPLFVGTVLLNENKYISTNNTVALALVSLIKKMTTSNINTVLDGSNLFKKFIRAMNEKFPDITFGTGQEDSCEFLTLFLEIIDDNSLYMLFLHKYKSVIYCKKCDNIISENSEKGIIINIQSQYVKNVDTFNLNEHVKNYTSTLDNYKCSRCKAHIINRIYLLVRAPDIIPIMFNKFDDKYDSKYCSRLVFPGYKKKILEYNLMSTVEHFGGRNGGHYIAHGVRNGSVYTFNDTQFNPGSLEPTRDTYILFYQRI